MSEQLDRLLPLIATWGFWIVGGLLAVVLLGIWRLARRRRFLGAGALGITLLPLAGILFLLLGPMAPSLAEVRRLNGAVGQPAPELVVQEVATGATHRLSEMKGKVVLVNLWATWCPPCRKEMPALDKLQTDYANQGLVVLTVSDEDQELLQKYLAEHPLRTLYASSTDLGWYDVPGRPLTLVIDREGNIRKFMTGGHPYEDFAAAVRPWLDPPQVETWG